MKGKKFLSVILTLIFLRVCVSACQAAAAPQTAGQEPISEQAGPEPGTEAESQISADISQTASEAIRPEEPSGQSSVTAVGEFDFENHTVLLNSGYTMPVMGLGTYALDHDTCVNSVKSLLQNGGRLIDTAYMYHNEEAVGQGVRQAMEEYGIPREDIYVITKLYPNQFSDPEAAIDMALEKLDIGYIDMMLLHHPGTDDVIREIDSPDFLPAGLLQREGYGIPV